MKTREDEVILTPELYLEISNDKATKIATLKKEKIHILNELKEKTLELKRLENEKRAILEKISFAEINIDRLRKNKFSLIIELGRQKRLSRKLNKKISKDSSYIRIGDYYTNNEKNKTR